MITRRQALLSSSPPMRVLLGFLVIEAVVSVVTLTWNVVDLIRRRDDWIQPST
jgi:hypothetical protein